MLNVCATVQGCIGGVSGANAGHDASYSYTHVGSRLAFRGKLVRAESVEAYKAIREVL